MIAPSGIKPLITLLPAMCSPVWGYYTTPIYLAFAQGTISLNSVSINKYSITVGGVYEVKA
ncbi:hypothetical protein L3i20_v238190 [Paenibacillus sp. L3-i20]|nr:hypothetical protein L3i20_v238190 [Paenibacillus sp. L3-i20]